MTSSVSVLWVDDAPGMQLIYSTLLSALGVSTFLDARTAEEGLAASRGRRFNLILLDYELPDGNGLQLARHIREGDGLSAGARIVVISGHDISQMQRLPDAIHVDAFLTKPVTAKALRSELLRLPS